MTGAISSTSGGGGGAPLPTGPAGPQTAAFNAAASGGGTAAGLAVNGNSIDTGRYVISASNTYARPTDGGQVGDGMVSIYDKTTGTYVDAYGDPHLFTSAGDRANFMSHGMLLNLADGTKVEITPTKETGGVAYIGQVAVTKGNETVTQTGLYGGTTTTSGVSQGSPNAGQGFNPGDIVLSSGKDGSLGTLYTAAGTTLDSKAAEQSLDTMGGAPAAQGTTPPSASATSPATEKEIHLLQQLISMLQDQLSATGSNADTKSLISKLEQLVSSLLSGSGGDKATTINTLLPSLEQTLGQLGQSGQGGSAEASLVNQVISALMGEGGTAAPGQSAGTETSASGGPTGTGTSGAGTSGSTSQASAMPTSYNPSHGISGSEIDAMLAHANGTGPEVDYSAWDQAVSNFAATDAAQSSSQAPNTSSQTGSKPA